MTTVDNAAPPDIAALRGAFGQFATGVAVMTCDSPRLHGMTINSFASVSLEPPVIAVSLDLQSRMNTLIDSERHFGISILNELQGDLARKFSSRGRGLGDQEFDGVDFFTGKYCDAPLIHQAIAHFECRTVDSKIVGDHRVIFAEVLDFTTDGHAPPLVFFRGSMRHPLGGQDR